MIYLVVITDFTSLDWRNRILKIYISQGLLFTKDGKTDRDIERRVNAGNSINGGPNAFGIIVNRS